MKYDIITFGSAARDIFLRPDTLRVVKDKKFIAGRGLCFPLGSKIDVEEIFFSIGGGGTNAAATFANQGFKVAFCGKIGKDRAGEEVIKELDRFRIDKSLVSETKRKLTNHSVILASRKRERTILSYRGAAGEMAKEDIPWSKLKTGWFYLAPLSGKPSLLTETLVNFAKKEGIKLAMNPGKSQLSLSQKKLKRILEKVDILFLNQEEASLLTRVPYQKETEVFKKLDEMVSGICLMTKGRMGVIASDGKYLYRAKAFNIKPLDWTGAGDSFASGFLSGLIKSKGKIEYAMQLGIANAAACIGQLGAKNGLLRKGDRWKKVKVEVELCSRNNTCLTK